MLLVALFAIATTLLGTHQAQAAELRKCALPGGRIAYVSDACPSGSRQLWQRAVASDPQHAVTLKQRQAEIERWQQTKQREAASQQRQYSTRARNTRSIALASETRCERARQRRDRIRSKDWMRMTYDRIIQLDDDVAAACR